MTSPSASADLPTHVFVPGDGRTQYVDVCAFPGCSKHLSLHTPREGLWVQWSCGCATWVHPQVKTKPLIRPTGGSFGYCHLSQDHGLVRAQTTWCELPR